MKTKSLLLSLLITIISISISNAQYNGELIPVRNDDKCGYIDTVGNFVIKPQFSHAYMFCNGFAHVTFGASWDDDYCNAYIDRTGKVIFKSKSFGYYGNFDDCGFARTTIDGNTSYVDTTGNFYTELPKTPSGVPYNKKFSQYGFAVIEQDGKNVLVDRNGTIYAKYDYIEEEDIKNNNMFGFVPSKGELLKIKENDKYGLYNQTNGEIVVEPQFDLINDFYDGYCRIANIDTSVEPQYDVEWGSWNYKYKYGFINRKGKIIVKPQFDDADMYCGNGYIIKIKQGDKWGFVDHKGKTIIEPKYEDAKEFSYGLAKVMINGKWGYINDKGNIVIEPKYDEVSSFCRDNLAYANAGDKEWLIDNTGKIVVDLQFASNTFKENAKYNALDLMSLQNCYPFYIKNDGKLDFIDKTGKKIFSGEYDDAHLFIKGKSIVQKNGKFGVIDSIGNVIIEPKYEELNLLGNNLFAFKSEKQYGLFDLNGNIVLKPQFSHINSQWESMDLIKVWADGCGLINENGQIVVPPQFNSIKILNNKIIVTLYIDGISQKGIYNTSGKCVVEPKFNDIYPDDNY